MKNPRQPAFAMIAIVVLILAAGCVQPAGTPPATTAAGAQTTAAPAAVGILYTKGVGPMPTLLATGQMDGFVAWQPVVEVAPLTGIGRVVTYSEDFPPQGKWLHHPCCVFVARDDFTKENPEIVDALMAMNILSSEYINQHPDEVAEIDSEWLAGKGNFTYGNISVSSVAVLKKAIPTVEFSTEPSADWMNGNIDLLRALRSFHSVTGSLQNTSDDQSKALMFNLQPYANAKNMIATKRITTPLHTDKQIGLGYLMSDHHAALFVAIKKWQYFNDTHGIALRPKDRAQSKPELVELVVNGETIAEIRLVSADTGPMLVQLIGGPNPTLQMSYVGNPPAISAVDKGIPIHMLESINKEGSGLVVSTASPATDWATFVQWAMDRSTAGRPLVIGIPGKGSCQDVSFRAGIAASGLSVNEVQI